MGALIVLLVLIPIVIFILLVSIHSKTSANQQALKNVEEELGRLSRQLYELTHDLQKRKQSEEKTTVTRKEAPKAETTTSPSAPVTTPGPGPGEPLPDKMQPETIKEKTPVSIIPAAFPKGNDERRYVEQEPQPKTNRDIERFIGENLANKIGIAVLVLGISFFVKYAIDKNWINETGRVVIGLICGGILTGLAHYIRNSYRSFSSVLVGGGLTVFYFTIAFAFHQYHLIGQQAAFIIMVIISAFAVLLSLSYNRQELAILATIGGFITPFLLTTGQDNYIALFTYLCILNSGLMILAWFKRWPAINIIALSFTTIIYGGWLIKRTVFDETLPYKEALLFATLFYILFVAMHIINSLRTQRKFAAFDFIIVLSTNFLYYVAGMVILSYNSNENDKGLFTALLGITNLLLTVIFYRRKNIDRNFVSLLIGLTLTFISLAAPVQLSGNHVVLFWATESVVLLWLYQRTRIGHLWIASVIVASLMVFGLLIVSPLHYFSGTALLPVIINKGFITMFAAPLALFAYHWLLRSNPGVHEGMNTYQPVKNTSLFAAITITYLSGVLEIFYQFNTRFPATEAYAVYLQAYSFAAAIILFQVFKRSAAFPLLKFSLTGICLGIYLFSLWINYRVSLQLLAAHNGLLFTAHWIAAVLLLWLLYSLVRFFFENNGNRWPAYRPPFTWIATISIVLLLSVEMYHVILWSTYSNEADLAWWENLYYKAGLTILWSICSFTMMWLGMKSGFRTLRIISLSLFTVTLFKLFTYDIRNIPPGGKIAAFILLGVLLLTVSFMYQRLKKIIIDDGIDKQSG